ncbi:hypothetical protein PILCRDRAFT_12859 [Piloderma croceum F 1598]|uniref:Crinkler effector protein N-terminal domain-containing protein n=1 Tax=Piloderma croceum (strain F 1598) TaxID=765440 RepID=A0A0C3EV85_PILCF|nr:hypothetical protein PILCRDRAFT_12859 [Piloderma croceum F 1598]
MSLIQFKLKKADTSTRHANFNENPSWGYLSSVISQLFNIPLHHVGVAYINKHKNAKSLANKQELQGFYDSLSHPSEVIKFIVQDLMAPDAPTTITSTWSMDSNLSDLSQSNDKFKLFCWIFRKSKGAFLINIGKSETVGDLKVAIKKEKEHIVGVNTNTFNIWKLSSLIPSAEIDLKLGNVQTMEGVLGCTRLDPLDELLEHFLLPPRKHLHIVVQLSHAEFLALFRVDAWPQDIVLLINEFSELYNAQPNIQNECLQAFRKIRNNNKMYVIHSVITVGTFGIMNLQPYNSAISPVNVADHVQNPYFTVTDVRKLFHKFAQDHCIMIDDAVVEDIWAKLNGCVTLLNWSMKAQILS